MGSTWEDESEQAMKEAMLLERLAICQPKVEKINELHFKSVGRAFMPTVNVSHQVKACPLFENAMKSVADQVALNKISDEVKKQQKISLSLLGLSIGVAHAKGALALPATPSTAQSTPAAQTMLKLPGFAVANKKESVTLGVQCESKYQSVFSEDAETQMTPRSDADESYETATNLDHEDAPEYDAQFVNMKTMKQIRNEASAMSPVSTMFASSKDSTDSSFEEECIYNPSNSTPSNRLKTAMRLASKDFVPVETKAIRRYDPDFNPKALAIYTGDKNTHTLATQTTEEDLMSAQIQHEFELYLESEQEERDVEMMKEVYEECGINMFGDDVETDEEAWVEKAGLAESKTSEMLLRESEEEEEHMQIMRELIKKHDTRGGVVQGLRVRRGDGILYVGAERRER